MPIDITCESSLRLEDATRFFISSQTGKPSHKSRLLRMILKGTPNPAGDRVYLEAAKLGGGWVTTREAIQRYCVAMQARTSRPVNPSTPTVRRRALAAADRELDRLGV